MLVNLCIYLTMHSNNSMHFCKLIYLIYHQQIWSFFDGRDQSVTCIILYGNFYVRSKQDKQGFIPTMNCTSFCNNASNMLSRKLQTRVLIWFGDNSSWNRKLNTQWTILCFNTSQKVSFAMLTPASKVTLQKLVEADWKQYLLAYLRIFRLSCSEIFARLLFFYLNLTFYSSCIGLFCGE